MDVAIIEVGIGGQYDPTNIIEQPVACGVASLGYDHLHVLGDSLASIAWHKAGIFKVRWGWSVSVYCQNLYFFNDFHVCLYCQNLLSSYSRCTGCDLSVFIAKTCFLKEFFIV